ncbi:MAG: hypothetical protein ACLGP3_07825 [Acidobacteriota bacterium]
MPTVIRINRAPVLTLWAAVVAERLGFDWDEALTLGRVVAGLNAYSKGVHLGLFQPTPEAERERRRAARHGEALQIDLLHRAVPAVQTPDGVRALSKDRPIDPASVERYLRGKFGERYAAARRAMEELAASLAPADLAARAYHLYERFRPEIPAGVGGWGAAGDLDLAAIAALAGEG